MPSPPKSSPKRSPRSAPMDTSLINTKKPRLTTSEEIINRIKWDTRYPHDQFLIRYEDRFLGLMDTTMEAFLDAEWCESIPHHRIHYFLLNGTIVWDREKRLDLITPGTAMKFVKYSEEQQEWIDNENKSKTTTTSTSHKKDSARQDLIIFNNKKQRYYYQQYKPDDLLEDYFTRKNYRELALVKPTHISQKGGYYHLDITKYEKILRRWAASIKKRETFFMEEYRTPVFRLYLDLDFKTCNGKPFSMIQAGYMSLIQQFALEFFRAKTQEKFHSLLSADVIVTECHGDWTDATTTQANYKSGYRLYFTSLFVDEPVLKEFVEQLGAHLQEKMGSYPSQPENWKWSDIVDAEQVSHKRARMFGSVKWRRGTILGRKYTFEGLYDTETSTINTKSSSQLAEHLIALLQLTSVRLDGKPEISNSKNVRTMIVTSTYARESAYPIADLRKSQLEKAGFTVVE